MSINADNCEANKRLSDICQVPLVGCHSHRLALAVKEFVKKDEALIEKVNPMMTNMKSPNMSTELRKSTPFRPIKYVVTRWLSIMDMFDRYLNIKEFIDSMPKMVPFMLSPSENQKVNELSLLLKPIKSVTVAMQKSDLDLASTRTLLDELFKCVPNLDSNKKYIYPNASIVKNKDFENGIVKVIDSI